MVACRAERKDQTQARTHRVFDMFRIVRRLVLGQKLIEREWWETQLMR